LKRGGVVVPTYELAQHVERVLTDRGGVRGPNDLGGNVGGSGTPGVVEGLTDDAHRERLARSRVKKKSDRQLAGAAA
jgi:hypothetical protein